MQRRRFKQILTFPDRLANEAAWLREEADKLPRGPKRDCLRTKARQAEEAVKVNAWISSPELQPPK